MCEFLEDRRTYRVVHARGLPDSYVEGVHSSDRGMVALVSEQRRTVVVDDYLERDRRASRAARRRLPHRDRHAGVGRRRAGRHPGGRHAGPAQPSRTTRSPPSSSSPPTPATASRARARLEHQRRDAAHFRSLIESAPDAMIVMSTDGIILEANHQVGRLFGYEPDELAGQSVEMPHHAEGPERAARLLRGLHPQPAHARHRRRGRRLGRAQGRHGIPHGDRPRPDRDPRGPRHHRHRPQRHRAPRVRAPPRAPGHPRPSDRAAQPGAVRGATGRDPGTGPSSRGRPWRCASSTSTTSST